MLEHRANATDRALESLRHDVNQGFSDLRREITGRFDRMNERMDQHLRWVITTVITTALAILGANVGILTLLSARADSGRGVERSPAGCVEPRTFF